MVRGRSPAPVSRRGRLGRPALLVVLAVASLAGCDPEPACPASGDPLGPAVAAYVVHVSVDGLRPDASRAPDALPAFARLRAEGAGTDNARTDPDLRVTLPNHVSQVTGRPALGPDGHGWTSNGEPAPGETLHSNRGEYLPSVFDVVHDRGLRTAAYVGKSKLRLFEASYDADHGAPDRTGADGGRAKIDVFVSDEDTDALVGRLLDDLRAAPAAYTFVHLRDPDDAGHAAGWDLADGSRYDRAVRRVDALLGRVLDAVRADARLRGRTSVIVTSDHGGEGTSHTEAVPPVYTVPFYVWGAGAGRGDLYALNGRTRRDPGTGPVPAEGAAPPVRNGDAANLALTLLGLPPVPCSTLGSAAPLRVR